MKNISGRDALSTLVEHPEIIKHLQDAVLRSNGRHTFKSLVADLTENRAAVWIEDASVIVTEVVQYPTGVRWLALRIGAGDMKTLVRMMRDLEEHAKSKNYSGVEGVSRPGWARVGKRLGYKETHRFLEKEI